MLSGVGPADHLRSHGIDIAVDAPGVGANLTDRVIVPMTWRSIKPLEPGANQHGDAYAALRSDDSSPYADVHLICVDLPLPAPGHRAPAQGFSINVGMANPRSHGTVR